jgi:hypothetical protein
MKRPRSFEDYITLAKSLREVGGNPTMVYGLELLAKRKTFKNPKIQQEVDEAYDRLFKDLKGLVDERLGSSYEKETQMLKSCYDTGLEEVRVPVPQRGPDRLDYSKAGYPTMGDPFGDDKPLRKAEATTSATEMNNPGLRVKSKGTGKHGTVKRASAAAMDDSNVRGVLVEWDHGGVEICRVSELE